MLTLNTRNGGTSLLGERDATAHLERVTKVGVYRWVYATVARDFSALATLYGSHDLVGRRA
ncbi:hypothetical protein [Tenggerimyces flavus]|uniref:Uncharacterized protein n=1 Tax=Tenggerimyces flavus TaxID=1708749 RepID=A0ABV7YIA9_9ACTN|nr:hypothetical protein [Tenggerimyces flavus]MBM7784690.1 hypothetical protein [Tenggerimyces flavus]